MSNAEIRGLFVWHELMTTDPQGAAAFYCGLFRWLAHPSSVPGYTLWMSGDVGVGGLMSQPEESYLSGAPPSWLVYLGTADVDATVQAAQRLGGRVLKEAADIPAIGRFAVLADPQGVAFSVFTPAAPAPEGAAASGVISRFSWHELATSDLQGALDFYLPLFGWSKGEAHELSTGETYQIIERDGTPIGGIYRLQDPSKPPHWLTYVNVDDLDTTVATARVAGGQIVQEPREVPGGDRIAWILDPQGGAIALHEAPKAVASPPDSPEQARKTVPRRPAARKRSARRATGRPAARAARSRVGKVKAKAKAEPGAKPRTKSKGGARVKTKPQVGAKAKVKAKTKRKPVRSRATARKRPVKRATAKAPARGSGKVKKAARKARSTGKALRKRPVARRAKRKASRR